MQQAQWSDFFALPTDFPPLPLHPRKMLLASDLEKNSCRVHEPFWLEIGGIRVKLPDFHLVCHKTCAKVCKSSTHYPKSPFLSENSFLKKWHFWCIFESKSGFLTWKTPKKNLFRVTYCLHIKVGWILKMCSIIIRTILMREWEVRTSSDIRASGKRSTEN